MLFLFYAYSTIYLMEVKIMDYEGLMNGVMVIINLHMNMYDNLKKEASEKGDEKRADIYDYKYKAIRDVKMEIDKLALKKKNRE